MKRSILIIALVPVLCILAGLLFWNWYILSIKNVPIEVSITNASLLGFNTGTDKLYFGTLSPEGSGERKSTLVSAQDAVVVVKIRGEVAPWVAVSQNNVYLTANKPQEIIFKMTIPSDAVPGNYTGTAIIEYHRPLFRHV